MKLNESISTYDVAEALQGENGKFEVTSPSSPWCKFGFVSRKC